MTRSEEDDVDEEDVAAATGRIDMSWIPEDLKIEVKCSLYNIFDSSEVSAGLHEPEPAFWIRFSYDCSLAGWEI